MTLPDPEDLYSKECKEGLAILRKLVEETPASEIEGTYIAELIHYLEREGSD